MNRLIFITLSILIIITLSACQDEEPEPVVAMTFTPTKTTAPPTATPQPTATPTIPTPTRPSPTPTLTPSITPTSQPTSTPTITPLPAAYLTPSTPAADPSQYRLVPWTADHADNLGRLMEDYRELIADILFSSIVEGYRRESYYFSAVAYREARHRYPNDPRTSRWLIADLVNEAGGGVNNEMQFRDTIVAALNNGEVSLDNGQIEGWFGTYPSFFTIKIEELEPPEGYDSSYIFTINSDAKVGAMAAQILKNDSGYSSWPILFILIIFTLLLFRLVSADEPADPFADGVDPSTGVLILSPQLALQEPDGFFSTVVSISV